MKVKGILWSCLPLTIVLILTPNSCSASIAHVMAAAAVAKDIISVVKEVTSAVSGAWSVANNISAGLNNNNNLPIILTRFKEVSNEINLTEDHHAEPVNNFINLQLLAKRNDITNTINGITTRFKELKEYVIHQDTLEPSTLIAFAEWTVSPNGFSVHHVMDRLHVTMFGSDDEANRSGSNIFEKLVSSYGVNLSCYKVLANKSVLSSFF